MSYAFLCALITVCYLSVFFFWGMTFLRLIRSDFSACESIVFGYIIMQAIYQILYLPFFFARGSYRRLTVLWLAVSAAITVFCLIYNARHIVKKNMRSLMSVRAMCAFAVIIFVSWLAVRIGLRPRPFGADTDTYIDVMNRMVYLDVIWQRLGELNFHSGLNSHFALFSTVSLVFGIHPYYVAHFTMRFLGVALTSMVAYRTGKALLDRSHAGISYYGLALSALVPLALTFWNSIYTGNFFWMRTNEAKAYCQLILLPLAFSVCGEMFPEGCDRLIPWKKQMAIGLAAVPIAASSMTAYLLLVFLHMVGLIVRDRFKKTKTTVLCALSCMLPNICYLALYIIL